jgi:hypothetical protein
MTCESMPLSLRVLTTAHFLSLAATFLLPLGSVASMVACGLWALSFPVLLTIWRQRRWFVFIAVVSALTAWRAVLPALLAFSCMTATTIRGCP